LRKKRQNYFYCPGKLLKKSLGAHKGSASPKKPKKKKRNYRKKKKASPVSRSARIIALFALSPSLPKIKGIGPSIITPPPLISELFSKGFFQAASDSKEEFFSKKAPNTKIKKPANIINIPSKTRVFPINAAFSIRRDKLSLVTNRFRVYLLLFQEKSQKQ